MAEQLNPREARQGRKGVHALFILIAALILAAIAWLVVELYYFAPGQKEFPAEADQSQTMEGQQAEPQSHLDNPSAATPQQTKPAPPQTPQ